MLFLISAIILHLIIPLFLHPLHGGTSTLFCLDRCTACISFGAAPISMAELYPHGAHTTLAHQTERPRGMRAGGQPEGRQTMQSDEHHHHTNLVQLPSPALRSFTTQQNAAASWCLETAAHALADDTCPWSTGLTRPHAKLESSHAETTLRSSSVICVRI